MSMTATDLVFTLLMIGLGAAALVLHVMIRKHWDDVQNDRDNMDWFDL